MKLPALALALMLGAAAPTLAQTGGTYHAPRNAFGQPDLEGTWTNATITPLERPAADKGLVMSPEEVAKLEAANAQLVADGNKPTDPKLKVTDLPYNCGRGFRGVDCGYNSGWVDPGTKVLKIGKEARTSIIVDPADGKMPAMTPEARQRIAARFQRNNFDGPESRGLGERCILSFGSSAGPPMLPLLYNNTYQIVQNKDEVAIEVEMVHDIRHIRLTSSHIPSDMKLWMGDSIGHWEGDTLVVETVGQNDITWIDESGIPHSNEMKVIERISRPDFGHLTIEHTIDDPKTFSKPWSFTTHPSLLKGELIEYICQENNKDVQHLVGK